MGCPEEFAATIAAAGIALSQGKSIKELSVLAVLFIQLGYTIESVRIQKERFEKCCCRQEESAAENKKTNHDKSTV